VVSVTLQRENVVGVIGFRINEVLPAVLGLDFGVERLSRVDF